MRFNRGAGSWVGEFLLVALGVLAALAVDRWAEARRELRVEGHLLELLAANLAADSMDLELAISMVGRRLFLVEELDTKSSDGQGANAPRSVPDSLLNRVWRGWDPVSQPLSVFQSWPDFDLSDDAYQEMLSTGSLAVLRDPALRAAVLAYYRSAEDQGENERRVGQYQERFEEALSWVDVAIGDTIPYAELFDRLQSDPRMSVELRRASSRMKLQLRYYGYIEQQRAELSALLDDVRRTR